MPANVADRAHAPAPLVSRRLVAPDPFRWWKIVLGSPFFFVSCYFLWVTSWNGLVCHDERCVVRQDFVLRSTEEFPFDARNPPLVVVGDATVGKYGKGRKLVLRYPTGDVALMRGWPHLVEAEATRLRSYLAAPRGTYALRQPREPFPPIMTACIALFGLLMLLDGSTLGGWRRVRGNPERGLLEIDRFILGVRVKREQHAVSPRTTLGRMVLRADQPRVAALTLEDPDAPPRKLGVRDTPKTRTILEEVLAAVQRV